jgi:hypothetical protein
MRPSVFLACGQRLTRQRDADRNLRGLLHQRLFEAPARLLAVPAQDGIGKNPGTADVRS